MRKNADMPPDDLPIREPDQIRQDCARKLRAVEVFGDNYFSALATITIPDAKTYESSVVDSPEVVGAPCWARLAASKR